MEHQRIRRCAVLMIEPRERLEFDPAVLLAGDGALVSRMSSIALAPHLEAEVALDADELAASWSERIVPPSGRQHGPNPRGWQLARSCRARCPTNMGAVAS